MPISFNLRAWIYISVANLLSYCFLLLQLERLKSDLRDVLYSHKWTPDAYLLAKAYVAEDDAKTDGKEKGLPKLAFKNQSRKL